VVAILGPNGSGKITIVKLLCRLYDPDAGSIDIDVADLRTLPIAFVMRPREREIRNRGATEGRAKAGWRATADLEGDDRGRLQAWRWFAEPSVLCPGIDDPDPEILKVPVVAGGERRQPREDDAGISTSRTSTGFAAARRSAARPRPSRLRGSRRLRRHAGCAARL